MGRWPLQLNYLIEQLSSYTAAKRITSRTFKKRTHLNPTANRIKSFIRHFS